jgi:hypothetical protein
MVYDLFKENFEALIKISNFITEGEWLDLIRLIENLKFLKSEGILAVLGNTSSTTLFKNILTFLARNRNSHIDKNVKMAIRSLNNFPTLKVPALQYLNIFNAIQNGREYLKNFTLDMTDILLNSLGTLEDFEVIHKYLKRILLGNVDGVKVVQIFATLHDNFSMLVATHYLTIIQNETFYWQIKNILLTLS